MWFLIAFMMTLALIPSVLAWREWRLWYHLTYFGAEMPAAVRYQWVAKIGLLPHYYLIYEFEVETPEGDVFFNNHFTELDRDQYKLLEEGGTTTVRYSTRNPYLFRLEIQPLERAHWTLTALFAWVCTGFFILVSLSA